MNFKKTQSFILIAIITLAVLGCAIFYFRSTENKIEVETADESNSPSNVDTEKDSATVSTNKEQVESEAVTVYVHVAGQVKNPGVYELKNGLRVIDAVNMAGGPLQEADLDSLNLAEKLHDEEKIYVPKKGEIPPATVNTYNTQSATTQSQTQNNGKVNINTAGLEELKTLPGIGDVLAGNIIDYRNANGPFKSIDEIVNVPKIGPKTFENLKDKITI